MGQRLQGVRLFMKALLQLKALTRIVLVLVCGGADLRWGSGVCDCARAGVCQHSSVGIYGHTCCVLAALLIEVLLALNRHLCRPGRPKPGLVTHQYSGLS
jgi:hypothetical protein